MNARKFTIEEVEALIKNVLICENNVIVESVEPNYNGEYCTVILDGDVNLSTLNAIAKAVGDEPLIGGQDYNEINLFFRIPNENDINTGEDDEPELEKKSAPAICDELRHKDEFKVNRLRTGETYVSFEVAKLLIEKGFNEPTLAYAYGQDIINYYSIPRITDSMHIEAGRIPLPSQKQALYWLCDKRNLLVNYERTDLGWTCTVSKIHRDIDGKIVSAEDLNAEIPVCAYYDEVSDAAIKYCLENLIMGGLTNG